MKQNNATTVKSVRFPILERYRLYGYRFELPANAELMRIEFTDKRYIAVTSLGRIILKACPRCKRLLDVNKCFYAKSSSCKECHRILVKNWAKRNPDLAKKYAKKYDIKYRYRKKLASAGVK